MLSAKLVYKDATITVTRLAAADYEARIDFIAKSKPPVTVFTDTYTKAVQRTKELIDDLEG